MLSHGCLTDRDVGHVSAPRLIFRTTARFVYGVSEPFTWPFNAIFAVRRHAQYVFGPNVIVAMIVYVLIGDSVARLLAMLIEPLRPANFSPE